MKLSESGLAQLRFPIRIILGNRVSGIWDPRKWSFCGTPLVLRSLGACYRDFSARAIPFALEQTKLTLHR